MPDKSKIKEIRLTTGLTQKEFAEKYHIPYGNLLNWEQLRVREPEYVAYMLEKIISLEGKKGD